MTTKLKETDVELAERYASALKHIEDAAEVTEVEVELAERYAAALEKIEDAAEGTEAEVELAREYVALLEKVSIHDLSDEEIMRRLEEARHELNQRRSARGE